MVVASVIPAEGPSFGNGAFGDMNVDINLFIKVIRKF